jgi:hypothetical protein
MELASDGQLEGGELDFGWGSHDGLEFKDRNDIDIIVGWAFLWEDTLRWV